MPIILATYRNQPRRSVCMTTPSRVNHPCPRHHRCRRLFRRLSRRLCLLVGQCAAWPWRSNNLTPRRRCRLAPRPRRKSGRRGSAGIPHRLLLPVRDGGVWAAELVTPGAREGRRLVLQRQAYVRARRAVVLPNAARRPAQGSICLGLGLGVRPSAPVPPAIAACYTHQALGASCAQGLWGPAPAVLPCHWTPRGRAARRLCILQHNIPSAHQVRFHI